MRITGRLTDEAVLVELGQRLGRLRLQRNQTQAQLADEAGVNRKAVARLEAGEPVQLVTIVRVLRALGSLDAVDSLLPEAQPSPVELVERRGHARRRARPGSGPGGGPETPWRWGDER